MVNKIKEIFIPIVPDISGEDECVNPEKINAESCDCCGFKSLYLWNGFRSDHSSSHAVCTLCYLTGHLDSPTALHGRIIWLPELSAQSAIHLQRQSILAWNFGNKVQRKIGKRIYLYLIRHSREVEYVFGSSRGVDFSEAIKRIPLGKRNLIYEKLRECTLLLPPDVFQIPDLLLAKYKTTEQQLTSYSYKTYKRSDLYAEPYSLD